VIHVKRALRGPTIEVINTGRYNNNIRDADRSNQY